MDRKRVLAVLAALAGLALATVACGDTGYSGQSAVSYATQTPRLPSALELAARETAIAQETRQAMENDARGTAEALANQAQATRQVLDLQGTQGAREAAATREAWEFSQTQEAVSIRATATAETAKERATATAEAKQATATREAIDATATAGHDQATATAGQWIANVQGTQSAADAFAVEATRRAVARADEREAATQPLRAWWAWVVLAFLVPSLFWLGWRLSKVIEDRASIIRRKADEGEPFAIWEQKDENGQVRKMFALPLRSFHALMDTGDVPALPEPGMQDRATMRQQTANAIQARQVAATVKARKAHKTKPPQIVTQAAPALPRRVQTHRRRQVPGLVKVVRVGSLKEATEEGILPPQLAETIEGQWSEVTED
jgi:hypothetical protein